MLFLVAFLFFIFRFVFYFSRAFIIYLSLFADIFFFYYLVMPFPELWKEKEGFPSVFASLQAGEGVFLVPPYKLGESRTLRSTNLP